MKYGDWQLRDNSSYWNSPSIKFFPSSNSVDEGSLTTEDNLRNIVRRITTKNYALKPEYFSLFLSGDRKFVTISPGEGNIQGYDIRTNSSITIKVPETKVTTAWTLGISLSYDASNNVTGDVIVSGGNIGSNETFSGAYVYFFDECQTLNNFENILILGRVWCKDGVVLPDGFTIEDGVYQGRTIDKGLETDPFKENGLEGYRVEVKVNGMKLTPYDTVPSNITDISAYDSVLNPVELNRDNYTKPPTFVTNLQDYLDYAGDWYVNKYGDYMTGALRMNQFSIDRKIEEDPDHAEDYVKDSVGNFVSEDSPKYAGTDNIFISPRTLGELQSNDYSDFQYNWGGTIMTIVPQSYTSGLDDNGGEVGNYAALISQGDGETGLRLNAINGGKTKLIHYPIDKKNTENFLIENTSSNNNVASIKISNGQTFFDSYNSAGFQFYSASKNSTSVTTPGGNIQGPVSVDFRIDDCLFSVAEHNPNYHRLNTREENSLFDGSIDNNKHIELGVSCNYNIDETGTNGINYRDAYLQLDNLQIKSNNVNGLISSDNVNYSVKYKVNTLEIVNTGGKRTAPYTADSTTTIPYGIANNPNNSNTINSAPYIRIKPSFYTNSGIAEDYLQVGTSKVDDILSNNANLETHNKVVIARIDYADTAEDTVSTDTTNSTTFIEQDFCRSVNSNENINIIENSTAIFNKMAPFVFKGSLSNIDDSYSEIIGGIYSHGNIGASSSVLKQYTGAVPNTDAGVSVEDKNHPYSYIHEWVRFTRFGYDQKQDNDGSLKYSHNYRDAYNIEFNTNVANKWSNQIIWNYAGTKNNIDVTNYNEAPAILSYIHDTTTKYPNEEYFDQNMYLHKNPTYGIRNFLQLSNAGLVIQGDVNNPALIEDADSNTSQERFGVTILGGRIYNAVYNDLAETYIKDNENEIAEPGMVVSLNAETGKYQICDKYSDKLVVGVISNNYGMLLGGKSIDSNQSVVELDSQGKFFNVGISGKVLVNVDCEVNPGDLLISSSIKGLATNSDNPQSGTIIGKALSNSKTVEGKTYKQCLMQIMLA